MAELKKVEYKTVNGKLESHEIYSDGSTRIIKQENGIVDYILQGKVKCWNLADCEKYDGVSLRDSIYIKNVKIFIQKLKEDIKKQLPYYLDTDEHEDLTPEIIINWIKKRSGDL